MLGRAEPMVELTTSMTVLKRTMVFLVYNDEVSIRRKTGVQVGLTLDQLYGFSGSSTSQLMSTSFVRLLVLERMW